MTTIAWRLLVCGVGAWLLWRNLGPTGLVLSAPLFGVLLARPLIELAGELRHSTRSLALSDVQGRYYEHRGFRIGVLEDVRHHRWLGVDDVRKVVPGLPRAAVLRHRFPTDVRSEPGVAGELIRVEALLDYLSESTVPESLRLRNWLEHEVARPAAELRRRLGVRDEPPDRPAPPADAA